MKTYFSSRVQLVYQQFKKIILLLIKSMELLTLESKICIMNTSYVVYPKNNSENYAR